MSHSVRDPSFLARYAADLEQALALRAAAERDDDRSGALALSEIAWRVEQAREAFAFGGPEGQARRALHSATALASLHGLAGLARGFAETEAALSRSHEEADLSLTAAARAVAALTLLVSPKQEAGSPSRRDVDPRVAWKAYVARLEVETKAVAKAAGKDAVLEISASAAPVGRDFALIDAILAHLVRNAIDHGIEAPPSRRGSGKSGSGRIVLTLDCVNGYWFGRVADDGGGVDLARIREAGQRLGVLRNGDQAESLEAVMRVLATPGITTRVAAGGEPASESAGGIGLDAVRMELKGYDGHLSLERTDERGTSFTFSWRQQAAGSFWLDDELTSAVDEANGAASVAA